MSLQTVWIETKQQQQTSAVQPRHFTMEPESLGLRHRQQMSTMIPSKDGQAELKLMTDNQHQQRMSTTIPNDNGQAEFK